MTGRAMTGSAITRRSSRSECALLGIAVLLVISCAAAAQLYKEDSIEVHDLPPVTAPSHEPSAVLVAALDTVFQDKELCCGKDSALADSVERADPTSLKSVAERLDGRHLHTDGRPFQVSAEFVTPDAVSAGHVISMIANQHPPLMLWNSHVYVVYGVKYVWTEDTGDGTTALVLRKFLLWDLRYSDSRRNVVFDRETEDPGKVQGLLFLSTTPERRN